MTDAGDSGGTEHAEVTVDGPWLRTGNQIAGALTVIGAVVVILDVATRLSLVPAYDGPSLVAGVVAVALGAGLRVACRALS